MNDWRKYFQFLLFQRDVSLTQKEPLKIYFILFYFFFLERESGGAGAEAEE